MGLRPLLGPPCIPPEAPRWGFPTSDILRGLRGFRCGSFLASLGDLPARRAMPARAFALTEGVVAQRGAVWSLRLNERPAFAFALDERPGASGWLYGVSD